LAKNILEKNYFEYVFFGKFFDYRICNVASFISIFCTDNFNVELNIGIALELAIAFSYFISNTRSRFFHTLGRILH
jgi:hypothetical protein